MSDHYVDIEYKQEDPNNPDFYYDQDFLGYSFSGGGSHPDFWYWFPAGIYYQRPDQSIRLGDTNVILPMVSFVNASILGSPAQPFDGDNGTQSASLTATTSQCNPSSSFVLHVTYSDFRNEEKDDSCRRYDRNDKFGWLAARYGQ